MADELVVGIDFGTLSGRVVVVRVSDGAELGTAVHEYAHAVMEDSLTAGDGRRLPPAWALQNPDDYRQVLRRAVPEALRDAGVDPRDGPTRRDDVPAEPRQRRRVRPSLPRLHPPPRLARPRAPRPDARPKRFRGQVAACCDE